MAAAVSFRKTVLGLFTKVGKPEVLCSACLKRRGILNDARWNTRNITSKAWSAQGSKNKRRFSTIDGDAHAVAVPGNIGIELPKSVRTNKIDPSEHALSDSGLFYSIPEEDFQALCPKKGNRKAFNKRHLREFEAFGESALMVREPALEIINYLKRTNYRDPVQRYLLYGDLGTGKSLALQHVMHYCFRQGWLLVPTMFAWDWVAYKTRFKLTQREELLTSQWNEERLDQPVRALAWLEHFKIINKKHLSEIKTSKEYIWTKRERTEAGVPLGTLIDQGIARTKISTDVIGCIMREVRTQPESTMPRVLVSVDSVNALFRKTKMKTGMGSHVRPDQLSFIYNLKKLLNNTWSNGAVILATTGNLSMMPPKQSYLNEAGYTYDALGHEAFDLLDPHVPVEVPNYSDKEVLHHLAYYEDRKWLTGRALTEDGKSEIISLACNNPAELAMICSSIY